ncbi:MAG: hypothetical protein OXQ29_15835 [Rhodospirillaceae bacterium]|nr:hypothetical protein [Rhodospirillaceae bacterium]
MNEAFIAILNALAGVISMFRTTYVIGLFAVYKLVELFLATEGNIIDKEVMLVLVGVVLGGIIASNGKLLEGPDPMAVLLGKAIDKLSA